MLSLLFLLVALSALAAPVAAQTPPVDPFFFSGMSVQFVVVAVLVTFLWGFSNWWFHTGSGAGVLRASDYLIVTNGVRKFYCGFGALRRDVERAVTLVMALLFVISASIYLTQTMLQDEIDPLTGLPTGSGVQVEIANTDTLWVPIIIVLYSAWLVQELARAFFHSISSFGFSAFLSFVAWIGWVVLIVLLAFECSCCEPGQCMTEEIILLIFAIIVFIWSTYLFVWRLLFSMTAGKLAISQTDYENVGGKAA